jgi:hypothetical protein
MIAARPVATGSSGCTSGVWRSRKGREAMRISSTSRYGFVLSTRSFTLLCERRKVRGSEALKVGRDGGDVLVIQPRCDYDHLLAAVVLARPALPLPDRALQAGGPLARQVWCRVRLADPVRPVAICESANCRARERRECGKARDIHSNFFGAADRRWRCLGRPTHGSYAWRAYGQLTVPC